MKRIISKFSDKLLSNQQLKTVKGGNYYCTCGDGGGPVSTANQSECNEFCWGYTGPSSGCAAQTMYYNWTATGNYSCY